MIEREYLCEDGTPFPVRFASEADAEGTWRLDKSHGCDPRTPMGDALERLGVPGGRRAYEENGLLLPQGFDLSPEAHGFTYYSEGPVDPDFMAAAFVGCGVLVETHGSALGIWHELCLPATEQACRDLDEAWVHVSLAELARIQAYGMQMTMIPSMVCGNDLTLLAAVLTDRFGEEATLVAHELAQGHDTNVTLQADQQLWELGQVARAKGRSAVFFAAVDEFLAAFGKRAEGWDIACPTWDERREGFWAQVAKVSEDGVPAPRDAVAAGAARREALVADIESGLAGEEAALGRFRRRLARIEPYVLVREERALWQLASYGALRHAVLRRGSALVEAGRLDAPEDVLFLLPDEVEGPGSGDLRGTASARRAAHERWCAAVPPVTIGRSAAAVAPTPSDGVLRGVGAARGVATGTARVIVDLEDADRLDSGDVLVCVMTSPPWTPLFGIVPAIVADTGDRDSHPAIVAREYGIPCVLGIDGATRTIPDGATVTVDGAAGTVTIVG